MPADFSDVLKGLDTTLTSIEAVLDLPKLNESLAELEAQAADPDLWNDQERAQQVTSRMSHIRADLERVAALRRRLDDVGVMFELGADESDQETLDEAQSDLDKLAGDIASLEVRTLLYGEYDAREALVTINCQAGGVDAADWAEMLLRMYGRWAERHDYPLEVYDTSYAEEAGIKSVTFQVKVPVRLRHAARRARRPPAGAHQPVRQPGPPADLVRRRRRDAGRRAVATTSTSPRTRSGSTSTARPARAVRASTPPTPPYGSPTCRPASS